MSPPLSPFFAMIIHVKMISGWKEKAIAVDNDAVTLDDFKKLVERDFQVEPRTQGLHMFLYPLADGSAKSSFSDDDGTKSLAECGIADGHTLMLVIRFVGGA